MLACTLLQNLISTYDIPSSVRVVSKLISISKNFGDSMDALEWEGLQASLTLLKNITNSTSISLPVYFLLSEVCYPFLLIMMSLTFMQIPISPHWTIQDWLIPYQKRLVRLCSLFTVSGIVHTLLLSFYDRIMQSNLK